MGHVLEDAFFSNVNFPIAIKKIIRGENNKIKDIEVLKINPAFEQFFNLNQTDFKNKYLSELWPSSKMWIEKFNHNLQKNKFVESEIFSERYNKWLKILVNLIENDILFVSFFDITEEKAMLQKMLEDSLGFLKIYQNEFIYQQIADFVREVSGAEYSILNIFEENKLNFKTVALSGISDNILKATDILGFPLINKTWNKDDAKMAKLQNFDIFRFESLSDLVGSVLPSKVVKLIEKFFKIGDVYVLRIYKDEVSIGDFTLIFKKNKHLKNESFIILYARIVAVIVERNFTFNKLQDSNTRFGEVALQTKELIWETDKNGLFQYINTISYDVLGFSSEDIIYKKNFFELIGNSSPQKTINEINSKFKKCESINEVEISIETSDGSIKTFITNAKALFSSNDEFIGYRGAFHDISLEKKNIKELIRLSYAVEQSPASVVITDIDANIVYVNEKFSSVTGYSFSEVNGKNPRILKANNQSNLIHVELWKHLNAGLSWHGEFVNQRKNGEIFYELATISPVKDEYGNVINYIAIKEDITAKKEIEEELNNSRKQLEVIYNSIPIFVLIVDQQGRIKYFNNQFVRISNLSENELINKKICDVFGCDNNHENKKCNVCLLQQNIEKTFFEEIPQTDSEYHIHANNNVSSSELFFIGNTALIDFENQKHVLVCLSDISLQKENEKNVAHQLELQQLITKVANQMVISSGGNINTTIDNVLKIISLYFETERSYLFLFDEKEKCFINANHWMNTDCNAPLERYIFNNNDFFPWWKYQFKTKKRVCFSDINTFQDIPNSEKDAYRAMNIKSLLCFPLINGKKIAGFLAFDTVSKTKEWTSDCISVLEIITEIVSKNLFNYFAEESYRLSEERFKLLISANNDGIWDWQITTDELFLSPRWKEIVGYEDHEIEASHQIFRELIHPEDLSFVDEQLNLYLQGKISEYRVEFRMKHKKGHYVWIYSKGELLRDNLENPYRIAGSHTDITLRKTHEEAIIRKQQLLSAIVDSTDELMRNSNYVEALQKVMKILGETTKVDRVYLFKQINHQYEKIVEWFSNKYNIDKCLDFSNLSDNEISCFINQIIKNKSFFASDIITLPKSPVKTILESQKVLSILVFPLFVEEYFWGFVGFNDAKENHQWTDDEFSILNSFSGTLSKSIERTLLEERLSESLEKAKAASKAKSDFLSTMSHEIRTPLNGVIGFVDLMKKTDLNQSQQQYMDSVSLSANTLLDLITDVLDYSKIEAGKFILHPEETSMMELMEQIVDMIQFSAHKKELELILKVTNTCPEFVFIDSVRIRQVLINLLSNAIKFTEQGEVELGMEIISETSTDAQIRFWVKDTGIGINMDRVEDILESFTQADASVTRKYGGSGLGLAIVTKILNMMDSSLNIQSQPRKGSTFSFILNIPIRKPKKRKQAGNNSIRKVLVVDDNQQNREVLKEMLLSYNIFSDMCIGGSETLRKLNTDQNYDLLIIDYHMPEMDGLTLIESIRKNFDKFGSDVPIMFLHSSYDDKLISEKIKELNINAHFVKPLKLSQLNNFVRNAQVGFIHEVAVTPQEKREEGGFFEKSFKILITEDNPTNMLLVKKMLSTIMPNAIPIEAKDGNVAIDIISKADIDLVFMDLHMPEMSGIDATIYIRKKLKKLNLPIIALTADTSKNEKERCFEVGMNDFISKPVIINDIKEIIKKHLS